MRSFFISLVALSSLLLVDMAAACPVCAQRDESGGAMRTVALGVLIVMPWILAVAVGLYIRRGLNTAGGAAHIDSETTQ